MPGIACRAFNNRTAGFQQAFGFCVANNEQGSTVFNGYCRVHKLCFAQNRAAGLFRGLFSLIKGVISNGGDHVVMKLHFISPTAKKSDLPNSMSGLHRNLNELTYFLEALKRFR